MATAGRRGRVFGAAGLTKALAIACLLGLLVGVGSPRLGAQVGSPSATDLGLQQRRLPFAAPAATVNRDPHDLSGRWKTRLNLPKPGGSAPPPPPLPPGRARMAQMQRRLQCVAGFGPWASTEGAPTQIIQTPNLVLLLFEEFHKSRKIHLNSQHPLDLAASYAGDSIGYWDGDSLIVDTVGIKGPIGDFEHVPPTVHLLERIAKSSDGLTLNVRSSYYDTSGGPVPVGETVTADWVGGPKIMEWVCEDGTDVSHPEPQ